MTVLIYTTLAIFINFSEILEESTAEHGRGSDVFNKNLERGRGNWYIMNGNDCFLNAKKRIFSKNFLLRNFLNFLIDIKEEKVL